MDMRPMFKKIACFFLAGLLTCSGVQSAFAADIDRQGVVQEQQTLPAGEAENSDNRVADTLTQGTATSSMTDLQLPAKVRRLALQYSREQKKALHFRQPLIQVVRNRKVALSFNKKVSGIVYKSSNPKTVTVNKRGIITSRKKGYAVITAKYKKNVCHTVIYVFPRRNTLAGKVNARNASALAALNAGRASARNYRKKTIVIAGSSSADRWSSVSEALPGFNVVNTAIGGSTAEEWGQLYTKLILPYHPDAVILLVGSNDIGKYGAISGEECAARIQNIIKELRQSLGDEIPIFYISILINWNRKAAWKQEKMSNKLMKQYCSTAANTYYIDVASKFLKKGKPNKALFASDKLHPNKKGYQIFKKVIGKKVKQVMGS